MTELALFVAEQIKTLVPSYDTVELKATVSASSFSVEFFATVDGKNVTTRANYKVKPLQITVSGVPSKLTKGFELSGITATDQ